MRIYLSTHHHRYDRTEKEASRMKKATPLTAGLVSTKGMASPSAIVQPQTENVVRATTHDYFKSITLKLDKARYMQLKQNGLNLGEVAKKF